MIKYKLVNVLKLTNEIIEDKYKELLNNKLHFMLLKNNNKIYVLTKEKSMFEITDIDKFIENFNKDIYYKTIVNDSIEVDKSDLEIYFKYIDKYKDIMMKNIYGDKYIFGSVAVRSKNGFITTLRGKEDLNDYTYVRNVDHDNHIINVNGKKATLNAPLLDYLFKNKNVKTIVHLNHEYDESLPYYNYEFPGTVKDSIRNNTSSFNIKNHGVIYLFDKNDKLIKEENMKYPKYNVYENLYKRYFLKGVKYLIEEANIEENDKVLDICGGNGRLTKELIKLSNDVTYLDKEKDMIPEELKELGIKVYNDSIENFIYITDKKYNKVFCEQAINYWLLNIDIKKFSEIFERDALFIFNTFSNKPDIKPMIKEYEIDNKKYIEISYLVNNKVYHTQICEGYVPHFTVFDYISKEEYIKLLSPYFDIYLNDNGKSSLYLCKRR